MSNHEEKQKKDEYASLNGFFKMCRDPFAKLLSECEDISAEKQERPDIILSSPNCIYGIELIGIPLFMENNGDAAKIQRGRTERVFNTYHPHAVKNESWNTETATKALHSVEGIINPKLKSVSEFSYKTYIDTCQSLLFDKHNTRQYLSNLKEWFPDKDVRLCLLLDISHPVVPSELKYRRPGNNRYEVSVRNDYPFTTDFIRLIGKLTDVYRVLLVWHLEEKYDNKKTRCYVLNPSNIHSIERMPIWASFDIPDRYKHVSRVNLTLEERKTESL